MTIPLYGFKPEREEDIPFEIIRIEEFAQQKRWRAPHRADFYLVYWLTEGAGTHFIDFNPYAIQPETLYFLSAGQVQYWDISIDITGYAILFNENFLAIASQDYISALSFEFFHNPDVTPVLTIPSEIIETLRHYRQEMMTEFTNKSSGRTLLLQSLLRIFLIHAQRCFVDHQQKTPFSATDELVENYIRLVDRYYHEIQQVSDYAAMLGVTAGYLTESTRKKRGVTAGQLIQRRIVLETKRQLAYTSKTIGEIGFSLGFSDHSYFTRVFRRETGMSPSQFRKSIREKYQDDPFLS